MINTLLDSFLHARIPSPSYDASGLGRPSTSKRGKLDSNFVARTKVKIIEICEKNFVTRFFTFTGVKICKVVKLDLNFENVFK